VTAIKTCTGCLRHPRADCGATRRPAADYRAATGDLQELASVTVCARQSRGTSTVATHSQSNRARHDSSWALNRRQPLGEMSALRGGFNCSRQRCDPLCSASTWRSYRGCLRCRCAFAASPQCMRSSAKRGNACSSALPHSPSRLSFGPTRSVRWDRRRSCSGPVAMGSYVRAATTLTQLVCQRGRDMVTAIRNSGSG
jgi:hypothetical protein